MKIDPEHFKTLLEQSQKGKTGKSPADQSFQDILDNRLQPGEDGKQPIAPLKDTSRMVALQAELKASSVGETQSEGGQGHDIMNRLESVLDQWEKYSQSLGASDLRNSYSILESIDQELQNLQSEVGQESDAGSGVNSMVNELEVMTVTERIKFNRGDYL